VAAQRIFRFSRWPGRLLLVALLAIGAVGLASLRYRPLPIPLIDRVLVVSPALAIPVTVGSFAVAALLLPAMLLASRIEVGAAGVTVVEAGRRARFWWPEIAAIVPVTRRRRGLMRRVIVAVPRDGAGERRGQIAFEERFGGWVLATPRSLRDGVPAFAEAVNRYAPGVWRDA
jgi:hypothetical protein